MNLTYIEHSAVSPTIASTAISVEQVVNRVLTSGQITSADRHWFLQAALTEAPLQPDIADQIRRVSDRLKMGLLRVVD